MTKIFLTLLFAMSTFSMPVMANDFLLVSSQKTEVKLSKNDIKKIFLGEKLYWPDGSRIIVVIVKGSDSYKKDFIQEVVGMSLRQFDQHWKAKLFSGLGFPPYEYKSPNDVVSFLKSEPRAIGLISKSMNVDLNVIFSELRGPEGQQELSSLSHF